MFEQFVQLARENHDVAVFIVAAALVIFAVGIVNLRIVLVAFAERNKPQSPVKSEVKS